VTDANTQAAIVGAAVTVYASYGITFGGNYAMGRGAMVQSTTGGNYLFDSSNFFEPSASGVAVSTLNAAATAYYTYDSSAYQINPPFPTTQNIQMNPTGQTSAITVATAPPGLSITVDGTSLIAPQTFNWVPGNQHTIAVTSPQASSPGTQNVFASWSNGGGISQMIAAPASSTTYTAAFNTQYQLTTNANPAAGGTITAGGWFNAGTPVAITASPASGYTFTGFSGALSGNGNPQTIVMNAPETVTANFSAASSATTTALQSSANPSAWGQTVTFTATVTPSGSGVPTGSVTFSDGATPLGSVSLNGSAQASLTLPSLTAGPHSISAAYGGASGFQASSSSPLAQTVAQAATLTALTSNPNPSAVGMPVHFMASVAGQFGGAATGTVAFMQGATTLGAAPVSGGSATLTSTALSAGTHSVTAVYGGDANSIGSTSSAVNQTVTLNATSTVLTSSANPSGAGQAVTFTATVRDSVSSKPTGMVTFKEGATTLGTETLSAGQATFTTSSLTPGSHAISAEFDGNPIFAKSPSNTITQVVNKYVTTIALSASPNPSNYGQTVTLTAEVTSSTGAPPDGEAVTFNLGATVLGTGTLRGGLAAFSTNTLSAGAHALTAAYGGDTNFGQSTSSIYTGTVDKASTTTVVTSAPNPSALGQTVVFTASVAASTGAAPTGTVTFYEGAATVGTGTLSGGVATLSTSSLTAGSHSIAAMYGGSANLGGSASASITQVVH
jgi:hypothetical protein